MSTCIKTPVLVASVGSVAVALTTLFAPVSCGSSAEDLAFSRTPITSLSQCPDVGEGAIRKVCITDDQGNFYTPFGDAGAPHGGMLIVPSGRRIAIAYVFADGYTPDPSDVSSTAARTYAASLNVQTHAPGGCCSEDSPSNLAASHAVLQGNTMLVTLDDVPADGVQVAATLDFASLFRTRLASPCTLPGDACGGYSSARNGFAVRFYVGREP